MALRGARAVMAAVLGIGRWRSGGRRDEGWAKGLVFTVPASGLRWFGAAQAAVLLAFAAVIVPTSAGGPGALEAAVLEQIDRRVSRSAVRQHVYERGLPALDRLARYRYGTGAAGLSSEQLEELLQYVQQVRQARRARGRSVAGRLMRGIDRFRRGLRGEEAAVRLVPWLVRDVLDAFYSSRVAWEWLGYDGPPFGGMSGESPRDPRAGLSPTGADS
ncbi:MAG: gluconate 2-dehydrogenase subunit 3 family protein [Armatimonadota bacterium]|nr:gluconate 2-dehydrogenase subunit 3 family protein [Armatimonadota bacterium]